MLRAVKEVAGAVLFWTVVIIGLVGCQTPNYSGLEMVRQSEAVSIVWFDVFAQTDEPPMIRWVVGADLDCIDPNSGEPGFMVRLIDGRACREGYTLSGDEVYVAWSGRYSYSGTAMAHELMHAVQLRRNTADPYHLEPGVWELVDYANSVLSGDGL